MPTPNPQAIISAEAITMVQKVSPSPTSDQGLKDSGLRNLEGQPLEGNFALTPDCKVPGILTLQGPDTSIRFWNLDTDLIKARYLPTVITGVLSNAQKVSLVNFHQESRPQTSFGSAGSFASLTSFPQYVVVGEFPIRPGKKVLDGGSFTIDESRLLCSPLEAFGSLAYGEEARKIVEQILELPNQNGEVGEHPIVTYFTGKATVFTADTVWGQATAWHSPRLTLSIHSAPQFSSEIVMDLAFPSAVDFACALKRLQTVLHLLELLIGHPQNVTALDIWRKTDSDRLSRAEVYECLAPWYHRPSAWGARPQPFLTPRELAQIMPHWIERAGSWDKARSLFYTSFVKRHQYPHHSFAEQRLVDAANMFDLLPQDAVSATKTLRKDLQDAKERTWEMFAELPRCDDRDQILRNISRWDKPSLKEKIHHRAKIIGDPLGDAVNLENMTKSLEALANAAVDCRNFFVHGAEKKKDYYNRPDILQFLTETLEFIFTASDWVDAGWSPRDWIGSRTFEKSHPFDDYIANYKANLDKFYAYGSNSNK